MFVLADKTIRLAADCLCLRQQCQQLKVYNMFSTKIRTTYLVLPEYQTSFRGRNVPLGVCCWSLCQCENRVLCVCKCICIILVILNVFYLLFVKFSSDLVRCPVVLRKTTSPVRSSQVQSVRKNCSVSQRSAVCPCVSCL